MNFNCIVCLVFILPHRSNRIRTISTCFVNCVTVAQDAWPPLNSGRELGIYQDHFGLFNVVQR